MLAVTDAAKLALHTALADRRVAADAAFRMRRTDDGLRLKPDRMRPSDTNYRIAGRTVLVVGPQEKEKMAGQELDIIQTDSGPQFLLRRRRQPGGPKPSRSDA